jgi:hypothetical protein
MGLKCSLILFPLPHRYTRWTSCDMADYGLPQILSEIFPDRRVVIRGLGVHAHVLTIYIVDPHRWDCPPSGITVRLRLVRRNSPLPRCPSRPLRSLEGDGRRPMFLVRSSLSLDLVVSGGSTLLGNGNYTCLPLERARHSTNPFLEPRANPLACGRLGRMTPHSDNHRYTVKCSARRGSSDEQGAKWQVPDFVLLRPTHIVASGNISRPPVGGW